MRLVFLGPVFRGELLRSSRRRRYYFLRVVYCLILLLMIALRYQGFYAQEAFLRFSRGFVYISEFAGFAEETFFIFVQLQLVALFFLVPALIGGVVADEKERKTLHYLMATRLSSGEILFDKLWARLFHVGVFVLLGLPVLCLLNLMGGLSWEYVAVAYADTVTLTLFAAALALYASTIARRVRQAILLAYVLQALWLFLPLVCLALAALYLDLSQAWWLSALTTWIPVVSPMVLADISFHWTGWARGFGPRSAQLDYHLASVALHLVGALLIFTIAVARLRPIFRKQEGATPRFAWFRKSERKLKRAHAPACRDDAMLWKERYFTRTDIFTKLVVLPATIIVTVVAVLGSGLDESFLYAVRNWFMGGGTGWGYSTEQFNEQLRQLTPFYLTLWFLSVAGASASSITVERERDTWISLISTPLTGGEILRGKMLGAVWGLRGFLALLGVMWLAGLLLGAIHPLAMLGAIAIVAVLTWFVAALGMHQSLKAKWTARALWTTLAILFLFEAGIQAVMYPVARAMELPWYRSALAFLPDLPAQALLSYGEVRELSRHIARDGLFQFRYLRELQFRGALLGLCACWAGYLTWKSVKRFDEILDRPRVGEGPQQPARGTRSGGSIAGIASPAKHLVQVGTAASNGR